MIVIVIPAKGESRRLANKNMALVNGRPMIDWAIDDALASCRAGAVYVSTDSDAIAEHAAKRDVPVIRRPVSLGGEVPIIEVYRHAMTHMPDADKVKILVGLQPDHPDRSVAVDTAIKAYEDAKADVLNSTELDGTKNGAHYILSRRVVDGGEPRSSVTIVDECTNVHYPEQLEQAAERLRGRVGP